INSVFALTPQPFILAKIGEKFEITALLDTGANCSAVTPELAETLGCEKKALGKELKISVAEKTAHLTTRHYVTLDFELKKKIQQEVLVLEKLSYDFVLGMDFLNSLNAIVNLNRNAMKVKRNKGRYQTVPLRKHDGTEDPSIVGATAIDTVVIQPYW